MIARHNSTITIMYIHTIYDEIISPSVLRNLFKRFGVHKIVLQLQRTCLHTYDHCVTHSIAYHIIHDMCVCF